MYLCGERKKNIYGDEPFRSISKTIYDCEINKLNRLDSVIELSTKSSSSQRQGTHSMLWHGIYNSRKKNSKFELKWKKIYVTVKWLFVYHDNDHLLLIKLYLLNHLPHSNSKWNIKSKNEKALHFAQRIFIYHSIEFLLLLFFCSKKIRIINRLFVETATNVTS